MPRELLTPSDQQVMISQGITEETIAAQLALFRRGTPWIKLRRPCTIGDGIVALRTDEMQAASRKYTEAVAAGRVMKFVPASGAASRMFQGLLQQEDAISSRFLTDLHHFAFYDDLKAALNDSGVDIEACVARRQIQPI